MPNKQKRRDDSSTVSEERLLCLLEENLKDNFELVINEYGAFLFSIAYYYSGSKDDANDIVQEAMFNIYHALRCRPADTISQMNLGAYIRVVARNESIKYLKRRNRQPWAPLYSLADAGNFSDDGKGNPEGIIERDEEYLELVRIIERLPETYRNTAILYYLNHLTMKQVADISGIPLNTVKSHILRVRNLLKERR